MLTAAAQTATQSELQTAGEPSATGEVQTVPEDSKAETAPTPREIGDTTRDTTTLSKIWTLDECLRYALENNIQLPQSRNDYLS